MNEHAYDERPENTESETLHYIKRFITKRMLWFMLLLGDRTLSNKEIAEEMGCKPSALSNLINRMKESKIPLLEVYRQDKYVMYSLSAIALKYIQQYAETVEDDGQKVIHLRSESQECILRLKRLRESVGDDFEIIFIDKLEKYNICNIDSNVDDFYNFMECLENLIISDRVGEFTSVLEKFKSDYIREKLQRHFERCIYIRRLCQINAKDFKVAYELVDSYFNSKCQSIDVDVLKKCKEEITMDELVGITEALKEMEKGERGKSMSKEVFQGIWSRYFSGHEQLLYYIAEKILNLNL